MQQLDSEEAVTADNQAFLLQHETPHYPPECDDGCMEYKWKLLPPSVSADRFTHLVTQMQFRLREGKGRCCYVIGVQDDGSVVGLSDEEYRLTLQMVRRLASESKAAISRERRFEFSDPLTSSMRYSGELLIDRSHTCAPSAGVADNSFPTYTRIAFWGPAGSGKTTLMAVLLSDCAKLDTDADSTKFLDDGLGSARHRLLKHRHEWETGKHYRALVQPWLPKESSQSCLLVDAGGGLTRSTLFALLHHCPHMVCVCICPHASTLDPNDDLNTFLSVVWELQVPLAVVLTKKDQVEDALEWEMTLMETVSSLEKFCSENSMWQSAELIDPSTLSSSSPSSLAADEGTGSLRQRVAHLQVIPLFDVSCVSGEGLATLSEFFVHCVQSLGDSVGGTAAAERCSAATTTAMGCADCGFEMTVEEVRRVTNAATKTDLVGVSGRVLRGSLYLDMECWLGVLDDGGFHAAGRVTQMYLNEDHITHISASDQEAVRLLWVVMEQQRPANQSSKLNRFVSSFQRLHRPKGRLLYGSPLLHSGICWGLVANLRWLSSTIHLTTSCQPLVVARQCSQAARITAIDVTEEGMIVSMVFLYRPELLELNERVVIFSPPSGAAVGRVCHTFRERLS